MPTHTEGYTHRRLDFICTPARPRPPYTGSRLRLAKALQVGVGGMLGWSAWLVAGGLPYVACD